MSLQPRCPTLQAPLRAQRERFRTTHSSSRTPRTGTLRIECRDAVHHPKCVKLRAPLNSGASRVMESYSTPTSLHSSWMRHREQIKPDFALFESSPHPTGFHPSPLAAKDVSYTRVSSTQVLTCCVVQHPLVVACICHTRVVSEVSEPALESDIFCPS